MVIDPVETRDKLGIYTRVDWEIVEDGEDRVVLTPESRTGRLVFEPEGDISVRVSFADEGEVIIGPLSRNKAVELETFRKLLPERIL